MNSDSALRVAQTIVMFSGADVFDQVMRMAGWEVDRVEANEIMSCTTYKPKS